MWCLPVHNVIVLPKQWNILFQIWYLLSIEIEGIDPGWLLGPSESGRVIDCHVAHWSGTTVHSSQHYFQVLCSISSNKEIQTLSNQGTDMCFHLEGGWGRCQPTCHCLNQTETLSAGECQGRKVWISVGTCVTLSQHGAVGPSPSLLLSCSRY